MRLLKRLRAAVRMAYEVGLGRVAAVRVPPGLVSDARPTPDGPVRAILAPAELSLAAPLVFADGAFIPMAAGRAYEVTPDGDLGVSEECAPDEAGAVLDAERAWSLLADTVGMWEAATGSAPRVLYADAAAEHLLAAWYVFNGGPGLVCGDKVAGIRALLPTALGLEVVWDSPTFRLSADPIPRLARPVTYAALKRFTDPRPVTEEPGFKTLLERVVGWPNGPALGVGRLYLNAEAEEVLVAAARDRQLVGDGPAWKPARLVLEELLGVSVVWESPRFGVASKRLPADLSRPVLFTDLPETEKPAVPELGVYRDPFFPLPAPNPELSAERPPTQSMSPQLADQVRRAAGL